MNSEQSSSASASYQTEAAAAAAAASHHPSNHAHVHSHLQHEQHSVAAVHPSMPSIMQHHPQIFMPAQQTSMNNGGLNINSGGLLYNNLIPGHYRYGVKPPAPPPGPLSYSNASSSQHSHHVKQQQQQQQQSLHSMKSSSQNHGAAQHALLQHTYQNVPRAATSSSSGAVTTTTTTTTQAAMMSQSSEYYLQVSEPDDEWDDVVIAPPASPEVEDDEQYYRPFRHHAAAAGNNGTAASISGGNSGGNSSMSKKGYEKRANQGSSHKSKTKQTVMEDITKPVDLLAVLLGGSVQQHGNENNRDNNVGDIAGLMEEAASKSQRARSMTNALAAKQTNSHDNGIHSKTEKNSSIEEKVDNDLYVATSNAHTEAALSFQKVYRSLLGLECKQGTTNSSDVLHRTVGGASLSPSEELAKSMLMLANTHARMAKSLGTMGVKWNMGKVDSGGWMMSKDSTLSSAGRGNAAMNNKSKATADGKNKGKQAGSTATEAKNTANVSSTSNNTSISSETLQHERLRMAVRGALDTANHEEDITNSTFLARSTVLNAAAIINKQQMSRVQSKSKNKMTERGMGRGTATEGMNEDGGVNPVDDLMKLEKELRCMDMALEMGNSVASLGAGAAGVGQGSFCVVPPGKSSYMTSSSMWTSGILGGAAGGGNAQQQQPHAKQHVRPNPQQQQGMAGVRSRANHLQGFLGAQAHPSTANSLGTAKASTTSPMTSPHQQQQGVQITPGNAALDQSWWGGGQGSILASSAISTAAASNNQQRLAPPNAGSNSQTNAASAARQQQTSTNTKQLMQLMDSLNRLGNENAQLMREVEDAKAARAEAKAAKDMMATFKVEYGQRFGKVKEALKRYPQQQQQNTGGGGGVDNPVVNSAYMKSASMQEIQKRDQMIKQLSTDLKKERDECKKKDSALQKYEAFYREVKARSAEKARQRQLQDQQLKRQQQQQQRP